MHAKANEIVAVAKTYIDAPYRHQGRNHFGIDCAGLVFTVAQNVGISTYDTRNYGRRPNVEEFTRAMHEGGYRRIRMDELCNGDLLRMNTGGWPVHLGIYEKDERGREWCIHAYVPHRKVTRDNLTDEIRGLISSVWRFPE